MDSDEYQRAYDKYAEDLNDWHNARRSTYALRFRKRRQTASKEHRAALQRAMDMRD